MTLNNALKIYVERFVVEQGSLAALLKALEEMQKDLESELDDDCENSAHMKDLSDQAALLSHFLSKLEFDKLDAEIAEIRSLAGEPADHVFLVLKSSFEPIRRRLDALQLMLQDDSFQRKFNSNGPLSRHPPIERVELEFDRLRARAAGFDVVEVATLMNSGIARDLHRYTALIPSGVQNARILRENQEIRQGKMREFIRTLEELKGLKEIEVIAGIAKKLSSLTPELRRSILQHAYDMYRSFADKFLLWDPLNTGSLLTRLKPYLEAKF